MSSQNPYSAPEAMSAPPMYAPTGNLASLGARFLGAFIDGLIMGPLALLLGMGVGFAAIAAGVDPVGIGYQVFASVSGLILGLALLLIIHGYLLATRGQTVGKVVMNTKIVSDQGEQLPLGDLILKRYLPIYVLTSLPFIGIIFGLINAVLVFRDNRKCLHDQIAGTKVIQL